MHVSLKESTFHTYVRQAVAQRLRQLADNSRPTHANRDDRYSPAQWWVDEGRTARNSLATSASLYTRDLTIYIVLNYTVV